MNRLKAFLLTTRLALLGIAASAASLLIVWSGLTFPWYMEVVGHFQYGYAAAAAGALVVAATMRARRDVRVLLAFGLPVFALQFASFDGLPHATASGSGTLTVVSFNAHYANEGAAQLADFGRRLAAVEGPVIAMGGLNATPWSAPYRRFRREAGLEAAYPSALGPASCPSMSPVPLLPLDHVLARGFDVVSGARGPDLGSDHYPVLARLARR
jgi:hypothetical protein